MTEDLLREGWRMLAAMDARAKLRRRRRETHQIIRRLEGASR